MVITTKITKQKLTEYSNQNNIILRDIKDVHYLDMWNKEFFCQYYRRIKITQNHFVILGFFFSFKAFSFRLFVRFGNDSIILS